MTTVLGLECVVGYALLGGSGGSSYAEGVPGEMRGCMSGFGEDKPEVVMKQGTCNYRTGFCCE